jgi:prophage DNA circulation protein
MAYLDRILPLSFAGYAFPARNYSLKGSLRHHVHEYPYAPGGAVERLGRKLYEVRVTVPAHETFRKYPLLLETMATLRTLAEGGQPWDLVIPHVGTMSATIIEWQDDLQAKARSGYDVSFTFLEDQSQQFLADKLVTTSTEIASTVDTLKLAVATRPTADLLPDVTDPAARQKILDAEEAQFDGLFALIDDLTAIASGDDLYTATIAQKAENAAERCRSISATARTLNEWPSSPLLDALADTWASMRTLAADVAKRDRPTDIFVTQARGTVAEVAAAIYGDSSRAMELLKMNAFEDALNVPQGTVVVYYVG